jgi:hypothetical protein
MGTAARCGKPMVSLGKLSNYKYRVPTSMAGWWFQPIFIFHNIWDNPSH